MADKIILGKKGNEHGIWVARPGQSVQDGGPYLMSSVADMLNIHAQGSVLSTGINESAGLWRHAIEVPFAELPFIPLAFMGFKTSNAEPFQFPPDLYNLASYNGPTLRNLFPAIGIAHNKLSFSGWVSNYQCYFNYTVFLLKIREKF